MSDSGSRSISIRLFVVWIGGVTLRFFLLIRIDGTASGVFGCSFLDLVVCSCLVFLCGLEGLLCLLVGESLSLNLGLLLTLLLQSLLLLSLLLPFLLHDHLDGLVFLAFRPRSRGS